jgi:hypothetical protein
MATLEQVAVHIGPNRFTVGYYTITGDTLNMIGPDGETIRSCTLRPTDNPKAIATVLTKEIRSSMVNPFWEPIVMKDMGIA